MKYIFGKIKSVKKFYSECKEILQSTCNSCVSCFPILIKKLEKSKKMILFRLEKSKIVVFLQLEKSIRQ